MLILCYFLDSWDHLVMVFGSTTTKFKMDKVVEFLGNKVNRVKGQPPVLRHFQTTSPSSEDVGDTRRSTTFARSEDFLKRCSGRVLSQLKRLSWFMVDHKRKGRRRRTKMKEAIQIPWEI